MKVVAITKKQCPRCVQAKNLLEGDTRVTWLNHQTTQSEDDARQRTLEITMGARAQMGTIQYNFHAPLSALSIRILASIASSSW